MSKRSTHLLAGLWLCTLTLPAWAASPNNPNLPPNSPGVPDPTASTDVRPTGQEKTATNPPATPHHIPAADRDYLVQSARSDVLQIRLGQLAAQQADAPALKKFASRIVTDHTSLTRQRDELVAMSDAKLPKDLDKAGSDEVDRLAPLDQKSFDHPYLQAAVDSETKTLAATQAEVAHGADPRVVAWAKGTLPMLERDVKTAKRLEQAGPRT